MIVVWCECNSLCQSKTFYRVCRCRNTMCVELYSCRNIDRILDLALFVILDELVRLVADCLACKQSQPINREIPYH